MSNRLTFQIHEVKHFSEEEQNKFYGAIVKAEDVLNSIEFKNRFLNLPLVQTKGLTNRQIFDLLVSGVDNFNKEIDHDIDVYITLYYSFKNTVGYTYPSTWWTWINRKFFSRFDEAEVAGNVIHEYAHNMGFDHISASDLWSVPYAIGYLVRDMIKEKDQYGKYLTPYEIVNQVPDESNVVYRESVWSKLKRLIINIFR